MVVFPRMPEEATGQPAGVTVLDPFLKAEFHRTFAQAGLLANFFRSWAAFLAIALAGLAVDALGDRPGSPELLRVRPLPSPPP